MKTLVIGGDSIKEDLSSISFSFETGLDNILLDSYDFIIVEDWFFDGDSKVKKNGKEFIFKIRLEYSWIKPIILVWNVEPSSNDTFIEVLKDPYVLSIYIGRLLRKYNTPVKVLDLFFPIQNQEDRNLLYQDLRNTIYREGGYLIEIEHGLINQIDAVIDDLEEIKKLIRIAWKTIDRILTQWTLKKHSRLSVRKSFNDCCELKSTILVKNELKKVFKELNADIENNTKEKLAPNNVELLYISDVEKNHKRFEALLERFYENYHIKGACVKNLEEAHIKIQNSPYITAVLCDYRFWNTPSAKISKENGYHILKYLKRDYPFLHYALLTDFKETHILTPSSIANIDIFEKRATFNQSSNEFFRLAKNILQKSEFALTLRGKWPKGLNTKEDNAWRNAHDNFFLKDAAIYQWENEIGNVSMNIIIALLNDRGTEVDIPKTASFFSRISDGSKLQALKKRLINRRVIIGLLNCNNLINDFGNFTIENKQEAPDKSEKTNLEIIYQFLKTGKAEGELPTANQLSSFFTDNLRIKKKGNYTRGNPRLLDIITLAEHRWLISNYHLIT